MIDKDFTDEEVQLIADHLIEMKNTTRYRKFTANPGKTLIELNTKLKTGSLVVIDNNGIMVASTYVPFYSEKPSAYCDVFYVAEKARGKGVGSELMRKYISWAKEKKCSEAQFGVSSQKNLDHSKAMVEKLGFEEIGSQFSLKLEA